MIDIQITGTLPRINLDFTPIMDKIRQRMLQDAEDAFRGGGYYQEWPMRRDGKRATLSGVRATLTSESDETSATVSAMNTIHQRGGSYKASDRQRRFLFATHPEWRNREGSRGQGMMLRFPQRTYLAFTDAFIQYAVQELGDQLFTMEETIESFRTTPEWATSR